MLNENNINDVQNKGNGEINRAKHTTLESVI